MQPKMLRLAKRRGEHIAGLHFNVVCGGANMIPWTGVSLPGLVFASLCDFLQVSLLNLASVSSS